PASTSADQRRLKSSSMQREANGSPGSKRSYAATLAKTTDNVPRAGRSRSRRTQSSAMAPQTSLPCVRACTRTCGPARPAAKVHPPIRVGCLRGWTPPANDRGDAGLMGKRRLAAKGNFAEFVGSGARLTELGDLAAAVRVEAGQRRDLIKLDVRCRIDRVH